MKAAARTFPLLEPGRLGVAARPGTVWHEASELGSVAGDESVGEMGRSLGTWARGHAAGRTEVGEQCECSGTLVEHGAIGLDQPPALRSPLRDDLLEQALHRRVVQCQERQSPAAIESLDHAC